jgi:polyisoprenoid-binding protein YceI
MIQKIIFFLLWIPSLVFAVPLSWQIVPKESTLTFTATQNNAPVSGQFKTFSGDIRFDPSELGASHVRIVVDMNSLGTAYPELTSTLTSPDWFHVKLFPEAIFETQKITKKSDNTFEASGVLTIRDKTLPITLTFTLETYSALDAQVKGHAVLKRSAFGVGQGEWSSTKEIKDEVAVDFNVVAKKR